MVVQIQGEVKLQQGTYVLAILVQDLVREVATIFKMNIV